MANNYIDLLKENNQEHLLKYLEMANEEQKQELINEIMDLDFKHIKELYSLSSRDNEKAIESCIIEHTKFVDKYKISEEEFNKYKNIGEEIIKNGEYAVVTMAGGQGTRLGHNGPKGTYILNVKPEPKSLFEILVDGIKRANSKYGITLNWYIMTSTENNDKTAQYFESKNYFGYPKDKIRFFEQGNLPLISEDGKLLVDENLHIKYAADGNGCIYKAMKKNGILDDMKSKNIKWIFIGSVDNALLNMVDPILLGLTVSEGNKIGSKSVVKRSPDEPVGVFCKKNSKPAVIEYTELPTEMARETDEEGELLFGESHIMCNLYSLEALEIISQNTLPYHSAHKKAPYLDENRNMIKVTKPNAYKYEAFIFDGFVFFDGISILRGRREEDFAPVKNAEGQDSPQTAVELYNNYWENNENGRM